MKKRSRTLALAACAALPLAPGWSPAATAWELQMTRIEYEQTADRETSYEFYAYSVGRLIGEPGDLDGVLISSCPWSSSSGYPIYCGAGRYYHKDAPGNFHEGQNFHCTHPNYTVRGDVDKVECESGQFASYRGKGWIQRCRSYVSCNKTEVGGASIEDPTFHEVPCIPPQEDGSDPKDADPPPCECSPLVADLDRNGFHFTGLDDSVEFDIDFDGSRETMTWTSATQQDGFLALDRNGNGSVDSGSELFGDSTPLLDGSTAQHGFEALAEFDTDLAGGNNDGIIDAQDAVYSQLLLWIDGNHNGYSEPGEQHPLTEFGVTRIELEYIENRRRDRHGNRLRYNGRLWRANHAGAELPSNVTDVFFVLAEE